jgi:small-conductance mechanosensitive channel
MEHWQSLGEKLFLFAAVALVLHLLVRLAHRQADVFVEDPVRRHTVRKWVGYGYIAVLGLVSLGLFSSALARLGTILALLLAGLAVALQDVLKSVVAWLYISSRSGLRIGDRVEVNGVGRGAGSTLEHGAKSAGERLQPGQRPGRAPPRYT